MGYELNTCMGSDIVECAIIKNNCLLFKPFNNGFYKINYNNLLKFFKDIYCPNSIISFNNINEVFNTYYIDHVVKSIINNDQLENYCDKIDGF